MTIKKCKTCKLPTLAKDGLCDDPCSAPTHTPTPWRLDNDGRFVRGRDGDDIAAPHGSNQAQVKANAAFIVRAVNAYEKNIDILDRVETLVARIQNRSGDNPRALTKSEYDELCAIATEAEAR